MRRILAIAFSALWFALTLSSPARAENVIVSTPSVEATRSDDGFSAKVALVNAGKGPVTLPPTARLEGECDATLDDGRVVAGLSATSVTLTFDGSCFGTRDSLETDLDGGGPMPAITVKKPDDGSDWHPLLYSAVIGLVVAVGVWLAGSSMVTTADATNKAKAAEKASDRLAAYEKVTRQVTARVDELGPSAPPRPPLAWKTSLPALEDFDMGSEVRGLEAGWSFKDSWAANLTVASGAVVALLGGVDTLTAVLGEKPQAAIGVMTVAGLIGAAVIAFGNTVAKLLGDTIKVVTVRGLVLSTACVVFAAGLEIGTVSLGAWDLVDDSRIRLVIAVAALAAYGVLLWYALKALRDTLTAGVPVPSVPAMPDDALKDWASTHAWEDDVVYHRILTTYADWLDGAAAAAAAAYPYSGATSRRDDSLRASMI